ncbi:hypothetical protein [endosymbiont GvMRE of Glomus versiforme]|uniref:hypothetical protein n=1 Tax=endosymbiont GvMRE of Glomus versiforme TaxID=2039283 RepID=UPI000EC4D96D|nr:hypothetical protein [endosymbiont GvMRE of Glomus versiforme]RHZ37576.1 hypothetical protein GvMRE_I1g502 [endosymbiont GvMRE of Glomus versiforme]
MNQNDLLKTIQNLQENNLKKDYLIVGAAIFQGIIFLIMTLITRRRRKPRPAVRLMRIDTAMAKLKLDRERIKKEAIYEAQLTKVETGLNADDKKENASEDTNFLNDLQSKGKEQLDKTIKNVKDVAKDKLGGLKDKLFGSGKE